MKLLTLVLCSLLVQGSGGSFLSNFFNKVEIGMEKIYNDLFRDLNETVMEVLKGEIKLNNVSAAANTSTNTKNTFNSDHTAAPAIAAVAKECSDSRKQLESQQSSNVTSVDYSSNSDYDEEISHNEELATNNKLVKNETLPITKISANTVKKLLSPTQVEKLTSSREIGKHENVHITTIPINTTKTTIPSIRKEYTHSLSNGKLAVTNQILKNKTDAINVMSISTIKKIMVVENKFVNKNISRIAKHTNTGINDSNVKNSQLHLQNNNITDGHSTYENHVNSNQTVKSFPNSKANYKKIAKIITDDNINIAKKSNIPLFVIKSPEIKTSIVETHNQTMETNASNAKGNKVNLSDIFTVTETRSKTITTITNSHINNFKLKGLKGNLSVIKNHMSGSKNVSSNSKEIERALKGMEKLLIGNNGTQVNINKSFQRKIGNKVKGDQAINLPNKTNLFKKRKFITTLNITKIQKDVFKKHTVININGIKHQNGNINVVSTKSNIANYTIQRKRIQARSISHNKSEQLMDQKSATQKSTTNKIRISNNTEHMENNKSANNPSVLKENSTTLYTTNKTRTPNNTEHMENNKIVNNPRANKIPIPNNTEHMKNDKIASNPRVLKENSTTLYTTNKARTPNNTEHMENNKIANNPRANKIPIPNNTEHMKNNKIANKTLDLKRNSTTVYTTNKIRIPNDTDHIENNTITNNSRVLKGNSTTIYTTNKISILNNTEHTNNYKIANKTHFLKRNSTTVYATNKTQLPNNTEHMANNKIPNNPHVLKENSSSLYTTNKIQIPNNTEHMKNNKIANKTYFLKRNITTVYTTNKIQISNNTEHMENNKIAENLRVLKINSTTLHTTSKTRIPNNTEHMGNNKIANNPRVMKGNSTTIYTSNKIRIPNNTEHMKYNKIANKTRDMKINSTTVYTTNKIRISNNTEHRENNKIANNPRVRKENSTTLYTTNQIRIPNNTEHLKNNKIANKIRDTKTNITKVYNTNNIRIPNNTEHKNNNTIPNKTRIIKTKNILANKIMKIRPLHKKITDNGPNSNHIYEGNIEDVNPNPLITTAVQVNKKINHAPESDTDILTMIFHDSKSARSEFHTDEDFDVYKKKVSNKPDMDASSGR